MRKIETIDSLIGALDRDVPAVLVIVVETAGSAPREPGAWMAVFDDGRIEGTVGGGALEARAIEDARLLLASGGSRLVRYTIGGAQSDTGMVCGGAVELLFMRMGGEHRLMLEKMTAMFGARSEGVLAIDLTAFGGSLWPGEHGPDASRTIEGAPYMRIECSGDGGARPGVVGTWYREPIFHEGRAYVFGCGHVGRSLAEVLAFAGFEVVVCDDRAEVLGLAHLPRTVERLRVDYGDLSVSVSIDARDFVVVCTAGHASDFDVLAQVLSARPRYVGCLGSKKKAAHTRARLREAGFPADAIDSIHMPVGVPIACETPEEIAVSIAAQVVDVRRSM